MQLKGGRRPKGMQGERATSRKIIRTLLLARESALSSPARGGSTRMVLMSYASRSTPASCTCACACVRECARARVQRAEDKTCILRRWVQEAEDRTHVPLTKRYRVVVMCALSTCVCVCVCVCVCGVCVRARELCCLPVSLRPSLLFCGNIQTAAFDNITSTSRASRCVCK